MEEDPDLMLQLELGKKKKKKKKPIVDVTNQPEMKPPETTPLEAPPTKPVEDSSSAANAVIETTPPEDELILPAKKKKRSAAAKTEVERKEPSEIQRAAPVGPSWTELDFPPKKKRKRENITFEGFEEIVALEIDEEEKGGDDIDTEDMEPVDNSPWAGTDRDYTYEELLERVFNIMRQKNPKMVGGQKKKLVMKPPQVVRVGAKKTSFVNFTEICKQVHRQPKHLLAFLLAELGTSGSVDGNHQLVIKGRFQQKQIETVLRRYIKEYVTCHTCRSPETILQKETRLFFLQCETCGSRCSVQSIKSGFQAVMSGQRREQRARQQ